MKTTEQIIADVLALDLDPIKFKLMDPEEGQGWSREMADRMEVEYKRFHILRTRYPDVPVTLDKAVDEFWHAHILDTRKYTEDCQRIFGRYIHHFPYFGLRGAEDAANLAAAAVKTRELYRAEFGAAPSALAAYCGEDAASPVNTAYCGEDAASPVKAAYCGEDAGSPVKAAYCGEDAGSPVKAAYCGEDASSPVKAAYCGEDAGSPVQAAYCGEDAASPVAVAYCGEDAASPLRFYRDGRPVPAPGLKAAVMNASVRPTLPLH
ncbi:hypothetical protein BH11PSE11_BH11PSE11_31800 [soil metagenome]